MTVLLHQQPLVVIDTETATSIGPPHLLELGAVRIEEGEVVAQLESFVLPQVTIDPTTTAIHGIEENDVRLAPVAEEVLGQLNELCEGAWLVAHNARFDAKVLAFEYARAELEGPQGPWIDTLALARGVLTEAPDHKLATLVDYLDLDAGTLHRALADAVACWQVLEACVGELGGWERINQLDLFRGGHAPITIQSHTPQIPTRPATRVRQLERARLDKEVVRLVYGGAIGHPARPSVLPRFLFQDKDKGYLEAECQSSGTLKTYRLDRVQRVELA